MLKKEWSYMDGGVYNDREFLAGASVWRGYVFFVVCLVGGRCTGSVS